MLPCGMKDTIPIRLTAILPFLGSPWGPQYFSSRLFADVPLSLCRCVPARPCACCRPRCPPALQTRALPFRAEHFTLLLTSLASRCFPFACQI